ncbi:DUF1097 domain-containing protein [Reinekea marinisedimentorum]|uniref:Uncharacterized protein DUF1097 n=1 Tax=Reinekea marinisedimentorum TaxID=230495 RepID=A0A4R3I7F0_9GAMM|nr:DUF1097 domain-containing protein [Reinekea marinisedimentorum]TCS41149.1 uncharacterized protein DUF1097 [Reinekea marinisedimentorum]
MKFQQFIVIPIIVAFLAFTIQILDQLLAPFMPVANAGFGWIAFISWAMYFMAGCNLQGGYKTLLGYVAGIFASIAIMKGGVALVPSLGFYAFPVAVFIVVIPCISLERIPPFDFVPALFVGAGIFFGLMSYVAGATFITATVVELIYCVIGLAYGWATVFLRGKYEAYVAASTASSELQEDAALQERHS